MRKEFKAKLNGDGSRAHASASFTLSFDTRDVLGTVNLNTALSADALNAMLLRLFVF